VSRATVLRIAVIVVALGLLGWLGSVRLRAWMEPESLPESSPDTSQAGMKAMTLWFADAGGDSLVSEVREAPEEQGLHERLAQLVQALARGPERRGVAVVPPGTDVLHGYLDERGLLTLDVSRAFQQGFSGGSREEDLVVSSLLRTIGSNVPEAKQVLITCGGAPIASLGGHLPLDRPLDLHATP
jgi:hypothetical protein